MFAQITAAAAAAQPQLSIWDLCLEGGWIMIPLAVLLVISIFIFFEGLYPRRRNRQRPQPLQDKRFALCTSYL
jgi:biopolymer transport protein ExbB